MSVDRVDVDVICTKNAIAEVKVLPAQTGLDQRTGCTYRSFFFSKVVPKSTSPWLMLGLDVCGAGGLLCERLIGAQKFLSCRR